jgi:hypothetical protein
MMIMNSKEAAVAVIDKEIEAMEQEIANLAEIWKNKLKEERNHPQYKEIFG